jgi:hypothetical protein
LLQQLLSGVQEGTVDPVQALPVITIVYEHFMAHLQLFANDPMAKAEVAGYKQLTQVAEEVITNTGRQVQAMQRKAAADPSQAQGGPTGEQEAGPTAAELKMQEHQLRMQIAQQKAETDMQIKQRKADQDLALKDAERAMKLSGNATT